MHVRVIASSSFESASASWLVASGQLPLAANQAGAHVRADRAIVRTSVAMTSIHRCDLPPDALLTKYRRDGAYTDCYATAIPWRVEARDTDQLLLSDFQGRTRSWLMVSPASGAGAAGTRLYFGSAVTALVNARTGQRKLGLAFRLLLGFHKLYSRALLFAAKSRLARLHHRSNP